MQKSAPGEREGAWQSSRVISGITQRYSGYDSVLSLLRTWVQSLVRELRSHKLHGKARKQKSLYPKYIQDSYNSTTMTIQLQTVKDLIRHLSKDGIHMATKHTEGA